ncbi:hypothetical protein SAMN05421759_102105 [Roseivivax lentus]|uniref:PEP-CTERM sorting domain-containing protein n=1 Tax=Roseivivax lentus TaxID=633194 RepID=A0A1N7KVJ7_9RHOB|nr:hypothetical protein [Roseivivax lentus]SIS65557.1 hypothetical protein SAMN05421759_102105 [Roseivivax lentus]
MSRIVSRLRRYVPRRILALCLCAVSLALAPVAAAAETKVGSNVDNRVILGIAAKADALQPFLPEGWTPMAFPGGPFSGANVLFVAIDRLVQLDGEGAPFGPANTRHIAVAGLGQAGGEGAPRLHVYRVYSSDPSPNPYGNSLGADITRVYTEEGPANEGRSRSERWRVSPEGGGTLAIDLSFTTGMRGKSAGESQTYSNTDPDFFRIYRYDQVTQVLMSEGLGIPLSGSLSVTSDVPELSDIFDGSEAVVGVIDVPVYVRDVFLP